MRRQYSTPLPYISPPVSAAEDEARRRFSSLSPTTQQQTTNCPLTLHRSQPHRHWRDRLNTDTSNFATWDIVAAVTAILAGHTSDRCLHYHHLATEESLSSEQQNKSQKQKQTMRERSRVKETGRVDEDDLGGCDDVFC
ncbi:hypothetical protein BLNAU_12041 [Blattamonas nauphoetae]|uniref:Uncharacterized protein n=1 Tax=Blattamonas nauphoetae TaxID=2049346 RepID=A0ABQ9XQU8_9EUKA|nr:hypothetical protein BLNAU_12041 [Blattamonas nauphoetae]